MSKVMRSIFEEFRDREEKRRKQWFKENEEITEEIEKLEERDKSLQKDQLELRESLDRDRSDYLKLILDHEKKVLKAIQENEKKIEKIRRGELRLYEAKFDHPQDIRKRLRSEFRASTHPMIEAIRKKENDLRRIYLERLSNEMKIRIVKADRFSYYKSFLENLSKAVDRHIPRVSYSEQVRQEQIRIENDIVMYEKGGFVVPRSFRIESMEDLECLILDARIQAKDEPALDEKIAELRERFDFKTHYLIVHYRSVPSDPSGHAGFTSWNEFPRSKDHSITGTAKKVKRELGNLK